MTSIRRSLFLGLTVLLACATLSVAASDSAPAPATPVEPPPAELDQQLFTPEPEPAGQCIACVGSFQTTGTWGMGSSCSAALADLEDHVDDLALDFCHNAFGPLSRPCNVQVFTAACQSQNGQFVHDGYGIHSCLDGDYFCPEW